jgi:alpha-L-fucosidase
MWFDGANGGDGWYGGAKERRRIGGDYYRFPEVFKFVRELQPKVCIFAGESDESDFRWPGNEKGELDPNSCATICTVGGFVDGKYGNPEYKNRINRGMRRFENTAAQPMFFRVCECDFPMRPGWFYHERERGRTKSAAYLMQRYLNTVGNGGTMNIGIAPNKDGRLDEEDVKALKGFKTLKDAFFGDCRGKCNVIVAWEDVSNGEISRDWTVKYKDKVVASGTTLGIKRIRVLDEAVPNNDLEWNSGNIDGTPGEGYSAHVRFYYADPELVKIVKSATTESGETDTAKWMTAGRQDATTFH